MSLEGENLGRWNLNYDSLVKFFPFPRIYLLWSLSLASFTSSFLFFFSFSFFFLSFFLQWLRTREISPREILNDEDFNFNVVEILHPVDRTPFYLQSLENFHSSLFFYDSLIFLPIFLNRGKSSLSRRLLNFEYLRVRDTLKRHRLTRIDCWSIVTWCIYIWSKSVNKANFEHICTDLLHKYLSYKFIIIYLWIISEMEIFVEHRGIVPVGRVSE